ncbi:MAG TPA: flagellar hook capping FlgD N-terminal domain-containing protein [Steroidobacteraceae bacterium]|jgi:flagellar basal-body rod modification protein FlgD
MAAVSNTQGANSGSADASAGITGNGDVSQLFTTLLVAQIKNQNPLEPADPSEFVGQMTQLSQMEALQKLAAQDSTNGSMLESLQVLALGGQVGSQVMAATDSVAIDKQPVQGRFTLMDNAADVSLVLESAGGKEQRITLGTRSAGDVPFTIDPQALGLTPGTYSMRVETATKESPTVEIAGTLQNVRLSPTDGLVLNVANVGQVASGAITAFNGRPAVN